MAGGGSSVYCLLNKWDVNKDNIMVMTLTGGACYFDVNTWTIVYLGSLHVGHVA